MISVEIKNRIRVSNDASDYEREYLEINGIADENSFFFKEDSYSSANFYNEKVVEILLNHTFNEVSEHFTSFAFHQEIDFWTEILEIDVVCKKYKNHIIPSIQIKLQFDDWEHWAKAWSMSSFANEF